MGIEHLKDKGLRADVLWPECAGNYKDRQIIIVGGGRTAWEDLGKVISNKNKRKMRASDPWDIMAVNDVGMHIPFKVDHWYSNDAPMLGKWREARRPELKKQLDGRIWTHSCNNPGIVDYHWGWPGHGSSGLNAVYTALGLGYDRIMLCGLGLTDEGHYFDAPWVSTNFTKEVPDRDGLPRYWEMAARDIFEGKVRSMSGRTQELLGARF